MLNSLLFISSFLFTILLPSFSLGQSTAFKFFKADYIEVGPSIEVSNMPKVKSQGPYDICPAYLAQYIFQHNICKQLNIVPCSSVSVEQEVSPVNLSAFASSNSKNLNEGPITNHTNLNLFNDGMNAFTIIKNASYTFALRPESCFPSDIFNNLVGNNRDIAMDFVYDYLIPFYQENKEKTECSECLATINRRLKTNRTEAQITRALGMKSFPEFLYALIFPEHCGKFIKPQKKPTFAFFPNDDKPTTLQQLSKKIETVVDSNLPIVLGDVCTGGLINNACIGGHGVVISGYKTICSTKVKGVCRKLYKVQNTWGQEWQDQNNDGWMDAEHLLKNVKTPYDIGVLSWLE